MGWGLGWVLGWVLGQCDPEGTEGEAEEEFVDDLEVAAVDGRSHGFADEGGDGRANG